MNNLFVADSALFKQELGFTQSGESISLLKKDLPSLTCVFRGGWGTNMLTESCLIDLNTKLVNCSTGTLPAFDYYLSYPEMFYIE